MEWISIKDKIPKTQWGRFIVCLQNKAVMEMEFSNFDYVRWFKVGIGDVKENNPVTHWMPMPKPANRNNTKKKA